MFVGILMISVGGVLIYAGVTGLSVWALLQGDNTTPSKTAEGSIVTASHLPGETSGGAGVSPGAAAPGSPPAQMPQPGLPASGSHVVNRPLGPADRAGGVASFQ